MVHAIDTSGARRRSHDPTAARPELGLGWPESTRRWTGTPFRAASLDCSEGSEERGAGRVWRERRVEGEGSRRTGPGRTTIRVLSGRKLQHVPLEPRSCASSRR